eukprot:TRINITY_DN17593_c0_g1_i1.p1 TRINITY_DN17593_c0_g1~~TRINITY_DN17593_c0_g1_i1.p1  ORF type:complete len:131 (+),score=8.48 TRINITY_DN17593_c0_g1_i1:118-510(+)
MADLGSMFWMIVAGALWGCTNPLMKLGSKGIIEIPAQNSVVRKFALEMWFLFSRWQYLLPFLVNMAGSIAFYYSVATGEISLAVPVVNSLTFLFTTATENFLGQRNLNSQVLLGMSLVVSGVAICVGSKT